MKNLKQRFAMVALLLSFGMYVSAQEFVVQNVKYIDNGDGTATVKEYRDIDGTGAVSLSERIRNIDKEYTVTGIASNAFKGFNVTSLRLPNTLKTISSHAFESISLRDLTIPYSVEKIEDNAFGDSPRISCVSLDGGKDVKPLLLRGTEFNFPVRELSLNRNIDTLSISQFKNSSRLKHLQFGHDIEFFPADFFEGCSALDEIDIYRKGEIAYGSGSLAELDSSIQLLQLILQNFESGIRSWAIQVSINNESHQLDVTLNKLKWTSNKIREGEKARRRKFIEKCAELIRMMDEEPETFRDNGFTFSFSDDTGQHTFEELFRAYPDVWKPAFNFICDSIFLAKEEFTEIYRTLGNGICNDQINLILSDSLKKCPVSEPIEVWARHNMLNSPYKERYKKNYERILEVSEKQIKSGISDKNYDPCYAMFMQLVGLCGLDRWKEAEQYFPKVHRAMTQDGKYEKVPDPLIYIQKCLTEHGYKPVVPVYAKKTTPATAPAKEPTNAQMVEFFINRGIDRYKEKQEQKRREEMYRQILLEEARKK